MRNTYTLCLLALFMCLQAGAQKNFNHIFSTNAIIQKEIQRLDSQFYTNYQALKAAENPMTQQNYYWNDSNSTWVLSQNIYYMYTPTGKVSRTQFVTAYGKMTYEYIYEYDQLDRNSATIIRSSNNPNNTIINSVREENTYDNQNRITQRLIKIWDSTTSTWLDDQRSVISYDAHNYTSEYRIDKLISGIWIAQYGFKFISTFQNNQLTRLMFEGYNPQQSRYDTTYQYLYQYQNNLVATRVHQSYDLQTSNFYDNERIELIYNSNNEVSALTHYLYDGNQYITTEKIDSITWHKYSNDMFFDNYNLEYKSYVRKNYDQVNNQFVNFEKYFRTKLDSNGSIIDLYSTWNNNTWELSESQSLSFDEYKNIELNIMHRYVLGVQYIDNANQYTNTYNSNGDLTQYIHAVYDSRINDFRNAIKVVYSNFVGINEEQKNILFSIYPNPSTGEFFIKINSKKTNIKIYDSLGRIIQNISSDVNIEKIQLAEKGIYFVEVEGIVEKLIIK